MITNIVGSNGGRNLFPPYSNRLTCLLWYLFSFNTDYKRVASRGWAIGCCGSLHIMAMFSLFYGRLTRLHRHHCDLSSSSQIILSPLTCTSHSVRLFLWLTPIIRCLCIPVIYTTTLPSVSSQVVSHPYSLQAVAGHSRMIFILIFMLVTCILPCIRSSSSAQAWLLMATTVSSTTRYRSTQLQTHNGYTLWVEWKLLTTHRPSSSVPNDESFHRTLCSKKIPKNFSSFPVSGVAAL